MAIFKNDSPSAEQKRRRGDGEVAASIPFWFFEADALGGCISRAEEGGGFSPPKRGCGRGDLLKNKNLDN